MTTYSGRKQGLMPVEAYLSQDWFDREQDALFAQCWQFAGLVEDVTEPGDYITVQAGLYLQHILEKEMEFPNVDMTQLCLPAAAVETWRGMVFVHPQPNPSHPLMTWFQGVEDGLGPHQPEKLMEYVEGRLRHDVNANWKLVVENYIDGYHLSHLHSETLYMYGHAKQKTRFSGPHFLFYEPLTADYLANVDKASELPLIDHIPRDQIGAYVPMLFPNLDLAESEASWSTFHIIPMAPDKTLIDIRTKVMPVSERQFRKQSRSSYYHFKWKSGDKYGTQDPNDPMASGDFMLEDVYVCEQQQKAMRSPMYGVGATAAHLEQSVLGFQQHVLNWVPVD
ncbi:Rieske (2Fe-2S) protein [Candidatus Entotheonella serta]|nr:Rieske (2Fe-2S) protein [Candidatus Entotheonella serta]